MHQVVNDKVTGKFVREYSCDSCQLVRINGVVCHETGCPEAWKDEIRECKECGSDFTPEERWQKCCGHSCQVSYSGASCVCEECDPFWQMVGEEESEDDEEID